MIRVALPYHLRNLAGVQEEVRLQVDAPVTLRRLLDQLEAEYPVLRGTIRDPASGRRRAFLRFFACREDLSHESPDEVLPDAVTAGAEPFFGGGVRGGRVGEESDAISADDPHPLRGPGRGRVGIFSPR